MERRFAFRTEDLRAAGPGSWRTWLALALGGAAVVALLLVFGLVFLVLLPVFAVAGLIGRWWLGRKLREHAAAMKRPTGVIEGQYEVVEIQAARQPGSGRSPWRQ